jgi:hypothetical protein
MMVKIIIESNKVIQITSRPTPQLFFSFRFGAPERLSGSRGSAVGFQHGFLSEGNHHIGGVLVYFNDESQLNSPALAQLPGPPDPIL